LEVHHLRTLLTAAWSEAEDLRKEVTTAQCKNVGARTTVVTLKERAAQHHVIRIQISYGRIHIQVGICSFYVTFVF
jgi:hypothetical protein